VSAKYWLSRNCDQETRRLRRWMFYRIVHESNPKKIIQYKEALRKINRDMNERWNTTKYGS